MFKIINFNIYKIKVNISYNYIKELFSKNERNKKEPLNFNDF